MIKRNKFIKLPFKCLLPLVADKNMLKAYCMYGKLKLSFSNSSIHNIQKRKSELAERLEMSENTFRKYLGKLIANKLAWVGTDGTLRLAKRDAIFTVFDIVPSYSTKKSRNFYKSYELSLATLTPDDIRFLALQQKRDQIDYMNTVRITKQLVEAKGKIISDKLKATITKGCSKKAALIVKELNSHYAKGFNPNSKYGFCDGNMSSEAIAKLCGMTTKMSGNRFMHRLEKRGLITYNQRHIEVLPITKFVNIKEMRENSKFPMMIMKSQWEDSQYQFQDSAKERRLKKSKEKRDLISKFSVVIRVTNSWEKKEILPY